MIRANPRPGLGDGQPVRGWRDSEREVARPVNLLIKRSRISTEFELVCRWATGDTQRRVRQMTSKMGWSCEYDCRYAARKYGSEQHLRRSQPGVGRRSDPNRNPQSNGCGKFEITGGKRDQSDPVCIGGDSGRETPRTEVRVVH